MALPVLVMGRSGSGKTYSLKQFDPSEIGVIAVEKNRLSFPSQIKVVKVPQYDKNPKVNSMAQAFVAKYAWIMNIIEKSEVRVIVIDDSQYLLAQELMARGKEKGYEKFTDIASNFWRLIHFVNELEDENKIVYFLHHSEEDASGREKTKTVGKMLEEKLVIEGCFDIVLYCQDHKFYTQSNGQSTAKTPEGMFSEIEIPNDLKAVDTAIREYYGMGGG